LRPHNRAEPQFSRAFIVCTKAASGRDVRLVTLASPLLIGLLLASPAAAADTWSDPFVGVKRLHRKTSNQNINALVIDLCAPGVSLRATAASEKGKKTSAFGGLVGAQAAINGDFYGPNYVPNGIAMSGGAAWGSSDHGYVGPLAFGENRAELIAHEVVAGPEPWMREVVSGHPTILWQGVERNNNGDPLCTNRHPRTAAGLSADRRTLILAVVDGRTTTRIGMTCDELSGLLKELGAHDGVNLDGGGSSTMWLGGSVLNHPSDGSERTVANHLAVHASGQGAAAACPIPDYRAELVEAGGFPGGTSMTLEAGSLASGWLDLKNTGKKPWTPGITKLGTSEPRDRESPIKTETWLGNNRATTVSQTIQPGEIGRFELSVRAPELTGEYLEHFALVEEAVTWFADSGGPADDALWLKLTSVEPSGSQAGASGAAGSGSGGSVGGAAGAPAHGNGSSQSTSVLEGERGCACRAARPQRVGWLGWLAAMAALSAALRRRS
jgi:hypothetical protein